MSKFQKGLAFQYPILVQTMANPLVFSDSSSCTVATEQWEQRKQAREAMTDSARLADIKQNGYFPPTPPRTYSRSCKCTVCTGAYMSTFFKGILGRPSGWWESDDESYTFTQFQTNYMLLQKAYAQVKTPDNIQSDKASEDIKKGQGGIYCLALNRSNFLAVAFKLVSALWARCIREGTYFNVPLDKSNSTRHPQPSWTFLSSIDEVATLNRDSDLYEEVVSRKLLMVSAPGPFTEPQAMLIFGPIRSAASRGAVVVVNSDDSTLRNYIVRLQKSLE